jgi:hypothetical protein
VSGKDSGDAADLPASYRHIGQSPPSPCDGKAMQLIIPSIMAHQG